MLYQALIFDFCLPESRFASFKLALWHQCLISSDDKSDGFAVTLNGSPFRSQVAQDFLEPSSCFRNCDLLHTHIVHIVKLCTNYLTI